MERLNDPSENKEELFKDHLHYMIKKRSRTLAGLFAKHRDKINVALYENPCVLGTYINNNIDINKNAIKKPEDIYRAIITAFHDNRAYDRQKIQVLFPNGIHGKEIRV